MSRNVDRLGAPRMVWMGLSGMILEFAHLAIWHNFVVGCCCGFTLGFGWFCYKFSAASAAGGFGASLASGSVSLNTSAMYAGQAIGAALGGYLSALGI